MQTLTAKYRPTSIEGFIGLDKPRKIAQSIIANPVDGAFLFTGEPGIGKTSLALAIAEQMPAELHHVPSQDANVDTFRRIMATCAYVPRLGCRKHLVLVDEADAMSDAAQKYLLSKLDESARPADTVFIFTSNGTDKLEPRFLSRCELVEFSPYGNAKDAATWLELVWDSEAPAGAARPNFARIVKECCGNIRASLMRLQSELRLA